MHDAHILNLEGVENFRDIGGYSAGNGAVVRWGRLFRSGHLTNMSEFDCQQLAPLNISSIFDLRSRGERKSFPTHWHGAEQPETFTINLQDDDTNPVNDLFEQIMAGDISREEVVAHMLEDYASMPFEYAPILRQLFEKLSEPGPSAIVVHCTAGKDRTGCAVALVLSLLGIPPAKITEDYLLSNEGFGAEQKLAHIAHKFRKKTDNIEARIDALRPLVCVDTTYLDSAFDSISREMGDLERYFESVLELSGDRIEALKASLLRF